MPDERAPSEIDALLDRARAGDAAALDALVQAVRPRLFRVALAIVHDEGEADDVAQEALVRGLTRRFAWLRRGSAEAWLTRVAANLAKNRRRDRKRRTEILDEAAREDLEARGAVAGQSPAPDARIDGEDERARVQRALSTLSAKQSEIVRMRALAELSFAEIGDALGISEANARVTFHQARARLREALGAVDGDDADTGGADGGEAGANGPRRKTGRTR